MPAIITRKLPALAVLLVFTLPHAHAASSAVVPDQDETRVMREDRLDSKHLEHELQSLSWEQFRSVVTAVPKLKADVDAYGPAGWEYVKGKYKTYGWSRNIDRFDGDEKKKLAALIDQARKRR